MAETLTEIPRVDLADFDRGGVARNEFVDTVERGLHDIGFVFVRQPDSEFPARLDRMYTASKKLFALSDEVKLGYERMDIHHERGYTPVNSETGIQCRAINPDGTDRPNRAENWFIGPELTKDDWRYQRWPDLFTPNIWPAEVPELQDAVGPVYDDLYTMGKTVMRALEKRLGKEQGFFDDFLDDGPTLIRPLHYPAVTAEEAPTTIGACRHTDINCVTVLPASTRPGLRIRTRQGLIIPGVAPPGYVTVQVGDMLQHMTGGYFLSAQHEVKSPVEEVSDDPGRYSSALFIHPKPGSILDVIPQVAETPEDYPPIGSIDFLRQRLDEIGLSGLGE